MAVPVVPLAAGAAVLVVPPLRHRAAAVARVAATTSLGVAAVTARGARDLVRAAATGQGAADGGGR